MNLRKLALGGAAALALALAGGMAANAAEFKWTAAGQNGDTDTGSGLIDATPLGGGVYDVTNMTGTWAGLNITGLTTYAGDDQRVYTTTPSLDYPGLAFEVSSGVAYNFYFDTNASGGGDLYACGFVGYCEVGPGAPFTTGLETPDPINPISFTLSAVPEPATWALTLMGLFALGAGLRGARRPLRTGAAAV